MISILNEPDSVAEERLRINNTLKVLKEAQKVLKRDPDINQMSTTNFGEGDGMFKSQSQFN